MKGVLTSSTELDVNLHQWLERLELMFAWRHLDCKNDGGTSVGIDLVGGMREDVPRCQSGCSAS